VPVVVVEDPLTADGAQVRLTADDARANLGAALRLCAGGSLRCSEKTRRPSAATVASISDVLAGGDFYPDHAIMAFAWPLLLQAGGLAELAGGRMQLTARGRAANGKDPVAVLGLLWQRWIARAAIDELSRIDTIKGQRRPNTLTAPSRRRQAVAGALARLPARQWVKTDDLFAAMRRDHVPVTVARNDRSIWNLYIIDPQYGSLGYTGFHDWALLEGRYVLCVLFEYAATLGLVDVAYADPAGARDDFRGNWGTDDMDYFSRYDGLAAVRLNDVGGRLLGVAEN
jgi:hypothetical protein